MLSATSVVAQSSRPYVVFVNGWQNCCSWGMNALQDRLINEMNAEPRYVPYSNFDNDGSSGNTSLDDQFLKDGADFINRLSPNRPLILIGHSYGGDSVLKLLPLIRRPIQFVAVIDPVSTGGLRSTLIGYTIPNNVGYFFNRWQNNEPFPIDFTTNGSIPICFANKCDQSSQFALTNIDGKARTEKCGVLEFCRTKQVRAGHQSLPRDDYIQRIIGDRIQEQIPVARCPENNITIRPNSSNLEFRRGTEWNPCPNYKFIFQNDGNLVLYSRNRAIWATGTNNRADLFAVQADGNVVLYGGGRAVWSTNTGGNSGAFLAIQSDGNLVVYGRNQNVLWSTGTGGR